ncbi:hypothetical protein AS149_14155 [Burkholderia cenocepacia]|nr:hypothetical protein AS149_14155 [Burkholderia cenocepacia]
MPVIQVSTSLTGATPDTVAKTVTNPLESSLNAIAGIDTLSSTSVTGVSLITVTFSVDKDLDEAFNDVQSKINQARSSLPKDADSPVIQKFDSGSSPILWLSLSAPRSQLELNDMAIALQKRIETISGVGQVQLVGAPTKQMNIVVDEQKLAAYHFTYADIQAALNNNHIVQSGGRIHAQGKQYALKLDFQVYKPADIASIALGQQGSTTIRIGDVATIYEGTDDSREFSRFNGQSTIAMGIVKVTGANTVKVIDDVNTRVSAELRPGLPADVKLEVATDNAKPIRAIISALQEHLLEGTILTALIVWLFLKSIRATAIISLSIPVSLLGAVASLYFFGYTFNSFTLLGLLLLIGVVVDDSIVVLESVFQTAEHNPGMSMAEASETGASKVLFAVMAATLTLVCIFVPIVFIPGVTGRFFRSFAVVVTVGVLISWFVSMTLVPMLTSRYLKVSKDGKIAAVLERAFRRLESSYLSSLGWVLRHRILTLVVAAVSLLPAAGLVTKLPAGFMPDANDGRLVANINIPAGLSKQEVLTIADKLERIVKTQPETAGYLTTYRDGGTNGRVEQVGLSITLKPDSKRSQAQMMHFFQDAFGKVPGIRASVTPPNSMGGGGNASLSFALRGPNFEALAKTSTDLLNKLQAKPGMQTLTSDLNLSSPEATIVLDRASLGRYGLTAEDVALAAGAGTGSVMLGQYSDAAGDRYNIALQSLGGLSRNSPNELSSTQLRNSSGAFIPLSAVAKVQIDGAPAALTRVDQEYAVTFSGSPTVGLSTAMQYVSEAAAQLPPGYSVKYTGASDEMRKLSGNLVVVFGMALIMLYLVLGSQFNSIGQPFLVMLAQPLAVIGGIGGLYLMGQGLNIYSMVGLVLLTGLVAKNSILLVDRANQEADKGGTIDSALRVACPERLRPVVMTSLTIILSLLPAAMGFGAGAENNQPMAVAVIGGMVSSTVLTLFVVPAAYSLFVRQRKVG